MKKSVFSLAILFADATANAATKPAEGPAFNCAKAQSEVEKLICSDASLARLDHQLNQVFRSAAAKAKGSLASHLRAEQRGWIKGRNECWKANQQPTWITATWQVDTIKACVEAQYKLRTSELQSTWRLLTPRTRIYVCQNNPSNEIVANFFASDPATIRLERGDRTVTLWQVGPVGGAKYEGANVSLQHEGDALNLHWLDTRTGEADALQCKTE